MTDPTAPTTDSPTTGVPMTDPTAATTNPPTTGQAMTDTTPPVSHTAPQQEPMPDSTPPPVSHTPIEKEPMPDPTPDSFTQEPVPDTDESTADTHRSMTREDVARAILTGITCELGHYELRVLARLAERLKEGQLAYGPLLVAADIRNFRSSEAREEIEDALVSLACAWLKTETKEVNR